MKIQYFPDTDTLYIGLSDADAKIANTDMVTDNLIVDFDVDEKVVGITIEQASRITDLTAVQTIGMSSAITPY